MPESVSIHEQYGRIKTLNTFLDDFIQLKTAVTFRDTNQTKMKNDERPACSG